ncbi:hypothetical protein CL615_03465 [archaeon]|nr:hypothetical protein [archaeon]
MKHGFTVGKCLEMRWEWDSGRNRHNRFIFRILKDGIACLEKLFFNFFGIIEKMSVFFYGKNLKFLIGFSANFYAIQIINV